jgi:hypothetical protein
MPTTLRGWSATRNGKTTAYELEHEMLDLGLNVDHVEFETKYFPRNSLCGTPNKKLYSATCCKDREEAGGRILLHIYESDVWNPIKDNDDTPNKLMKRFESLIRLNNERNEYQEHILLWIVGLVHVKRLLLIYKHVAEFCTYPTLPDLDIHPSEAMQMMRSASNISANECFHDDPEDPEFLMDLDKGDQAVTQEPPSNNNTEEQASSVIDDTHMATATEAVPATE